MKKFDSLILTDSQDKYKWLSNIPWLLAIAVMIAWMIALVNTSACMVMGDSMLSTLEDNQYVIINHTTEVKEGDVVVFSRAKTSYIKRVIATEGESIRFMQDSMGYLYTQKLSGGEWATMDESYIKEPMSYLPAMVYAIGEQITVEKGEIFVMGDNRNNSEDSRRGIIGMVRTSEVMGVMVYESTLGSFDEWLLKLVFGQLF